MTEAEWLVCGSPALTLDFLEGKASARKLRLYSCACCQHIRCELTQTERVAVSLAEQFADGAVSDQVRRNALLTYVIERGGEFGTDRNEKSCWASLSGLDYKALAVTLSLLASNESLSDSNTGRGIFSSTPLHDYALQSKLCGAFAAGVAAFGTMNNRKAKRRVVGRVWNQLVRSVSRAVNGGLPGEWPDGEDFTREYVAQAILLRDIFGNPFRPVTFSPSWRTSTAASLASQMYESGDFGAMPILADALQDAGCDSADVLDHCRGPRPHVRGCWVVDLVLGKE